MTVYFEMVVLLNFLVDWLLLMGTNRLSGYPASAKRTALGAVLGGVYAGVCILPGCHFLGGLLWRLMSLAGMTGIAYGWNRSALRKGAVFVLLSMALGGIAMGFGKGNVVTLLLSAAGVALLCATGLRAPIIGMKYLPVELLWKGKRLKLTALVDTGNTLRDPISGGSVLVVGTDVGRQLGISREIINDPVAALAAKQIQGARLIPYRAVGKPGGMLLMMRFEEVKLNGQIISPMVAFAPEEIGKKDGYQALAGGVV
ncbi:MAG: hypothetical protein E7454_03065 [Ruminococcaceae bacterium]|nr:hypothetical protein [Oscillospiraceae bacterium]